MALRATSQQYVDVTLGHVVDLSIQLEPGESTVLTEFYPSPLRLG